METTDAPDRLLIQFSDGRFAFCPVSGGKIGTLASYPLPHGDRKRCNARKAGRPYCTTPTGFA